jgi:hypothetical protein
MKVSFRVSGLMVQACKFDLRICMSAYGAG